MKWYMYVLLCCDNSFYCGITTDLNRRLKQHNGVISGGAKYTRGRRPCSYVYTKKATDRSVASKLEYKFKKLSRRKKEIYINYTPMSESDSGKGEGSGSTSSKTS